MSKKPVIPKIPEVFTIDMVGDSTGERQVGKFSAKKRLTFNDQLARDNFRRQMLGAAPGEPLPRAASMAQIFSELLVRLIDAPSWWVDADEGRALEDENVVVDVYEKALKVESDAAAEVAKKAAIARGEIQETSRSRRKEVRPHHSTNRAGQAGQGRRRAHARHHLVHRM